MLRLISAPRNAIQSVIKFNNKTVQSVKEIQVKFDEKVKGTVVENWLKYWKNLFRDYKDVAIDVGKDMKEKPIKAIWIWSFLGSLVYCAKHNPDQISFRDAFINNSNRLALVHPALQKPECSEHLKSIERCYNRNTIRRLNIGIASIIWTDYYSDSLQNYQANCPYLKLQYRKFKDRIIDVGFLDRWWILNNKMIDYDINY